MSQFILTAAMEHSFLDARDPVEVCNAEGKPLGFYLPLESYKRLLANLAVPYSADELDRRRNELGGGSLQSFWEAMKQA